jgi:hypothetical protein
MLTTRVSSIVEIPDLLLLSIETGETQCYRVKHAISNFVQDHGQTGGVSLPLMSCNT